MSILTHNHTGLEVVRHMKLYSMKILAKARR